MERQRGLEPLILGGSSTLSRRTRPGLRPSALPRLGPGWLAGAPDLGLSLVPGLLKDHGRSTGNKLAAGSPPRPGLWLPRALGTLCARANLLFQVWSSAPCAPEKARIRRHQEPASQQGNGPWKVE